MHPSIGCAKFVRTDDQEGEGPVQHPKGHDAGKHGYDIYNRQMAPSD